MSREADLRPDRPISASAMKRWLPNGATLELPGRGTTFVRDAPGPRGAPTLVLLHGWLATADLNWGFSYEALSEHFRVVSLDMRGHGRGIQSKHRFSIADCADDVAALIEVLDLNRVVPVGYSMGGPVALELARRHPDKIMGQVLCATAAAFTPNPITRFGMSALAPLVSATRILPDRRFHHAVRRRLITSRAKGPWQEWITGELAPSDTTTMLEAGAALASFNIAQVVRHLDIPSSIVVTTDDALVAPADQRSLARALHNAPTFDVDAGHLACFDEPESFVPVLLDACRSVVGRADNRETPAVG